MPDTVLTELYKMANTRFKTERNTWGPFLVRHLEEFCRTDRIFLVSMSLNRTIFIVQHFLQNSRRFWIIGLNLFCSVYLERELHRFSLVLTEPYWVQNYWTEPSRSHIFGLTPFY